MNDSDLRPLWSDDELDAALAALHADPATVPTNADVDDDADIELGVPAGTAVRQRRGRRARWLYPAVAASVIAVIVAGVLVVGHIHKTVPTAHGGYPSAGPSPTADETPAQLLNRLADRTATAPDPTVPTGTYLYAHWTLDQNILGHDFNTRKNTRYEQVTQFETWIPSDTTGTWRRTTITGRATLPNGKPAPAGSGAGAPGSDTEYARCGDFYATETGSSVNCDRTGEKQVTPPMLASMPRDPHRLLSWLLKRDVGSNSNVSASAFSVVFFFLDSGIVPSDLRAAMYRALALVPGLTVTDDVTVGGHRGVAIGNGKTDQLVLDPDTGQFLGDRTFTVGFPGVPDGTLLDSEWVTVKVVDRSGATR